MTDTADQLDFNQDFVEAARNMRREAVEAERKRCLGILAEMKITAARSVEYPYLTALNKCQDAIQSPPPPAAEPEPMTIEKLAEKWQSKAICFDWGGFHADLTTLVETAGKDQAKRDADVAKTEWANIKHGVSDEATRTAYICQKVHNAILKAAGLDAEVKP